MCNGVIKYTYIRDAYDTLEGVLNNVITRFTYCSEDGKGYHHHALYSMRELIVPKRDYLYCYALLCNCSGSLMSEF